MLDENIIVLARPHPFIVAEMREFLTRNGYTPLVIADLDEIAALPRGRIKGVVISTSVISETGGFDETFAKVRADLPDTPILFATLLTPDRAVVALKSVLAPAVGEPCFITLDGPRDGACRLGTPDGFAIIQKDQIGAADSAAGADRLLSRHFN